MTFDKSELIRTPVGPLESSPSASSSYSDIGSPNAAARNKTVSYLFDKAAGVTDSEDFDIPAVRAVRHSNTFIPPPHLGIRDIPLSKFRAR